MSLRELSGRTIQLPHKKHGIDNMITETVAAQGAPGKMTCSGWKIHRPGSSPGFALPSPAYCFASVIV